MPTLIDPRGARVAAALTSLVLALVLLTAPGPVSTALLAAQTAVFAVGALAGVQHTPYALLFRTMIRPRLEPPAELEDPAPPRFAQAVGLGFTSVGLVAVLSGPTTLGLVAVGLALVAALLNAAVGVCVGCEIYLLIKRATDPVVEVRMPATAADPVVEVRVPATATDPVVEVRVPATATDPVVEV